MAFRDITEILGPITLPIRGTTYTLPILTIAQGLTLRAVLDKDDAATLDDEAFYALLLGDALETMRTDEVGPDVIARAAFVALADWQSGRPAAEVLWETGVDPKVLTQYLKKIEDATSTGEETTTPSPKPGNGTSTPKNSPKAKASNGAPS